MKERTRLLGALIVDGLEYPLSITENVSDEGVRFDINFDNPRKEPDITFRPADWESGLPPTGPSEGRLSVIGVVRLFHDYRVCDAAQLSGAFGG